MTTITLPIDPKHFWAIVALAGFVLAVAVVYAAMPRTEGKHTNPLDRLKDILGLAQFGDGLFLLLALMWSGLFLALFTGLLLMLWELIWFAVPQDPPAEASARFALLRLAAMTATLGAVVALPFTLIRIRLTREANKTADESLFNDKINAATEDLHAMRQRWDAERKQNIWEDDITRRNAAIDRLEGLVKERPDTAPRVSRLLSVYVRELSREVPAEIPPEEPTPNELDSWLFGLTVKRSDMENAVQVLGRMKRIRAVNCVSISIDLRHANLQRFDLTGLDLSGAILSGSHMQGSFLRDTQFRNASLPFAKMQGTNLGNAKMLTSNLNWADLRQAFLGGAMLRGASLRHADMQGAKLYDAELQKADFTSTNLRGADLSGAKMQGIRLGGANMQGADISATTIDGSSGLNRADLSGSLLRQVDFSRTNIGLEQLNSGFGTTDTILPDGSGPDSSDWPAHWPKIALKDPESLTQWRKWQVDPDNYTPPTAPDK
ncbi:pentapeptide repeat-containing protein [Phaeobacter inhibens]|uniref:pentapeptide repeat-containing protein n=1 Tax=Phaeobacter inhibens TaxID=221822 RepID=UPI0021A8AC4E|nr:pentapeptide repeat-containing protein [Phaeobacter inhibens]UWR78780.1 pentapeptide repeat-containing protein [Phaeobacter inhibens]